MCNWARCNGAFFSISGKVNYTGFIVDIYRATALSFFNRENPIFFTSAFMLFRPFRVEKFRQIYVEDFQGDHYFDSFENSGMRKLWLDLNSFKEITTMAYNFFIQSYYHRDFPKEVLINVIEVYEFNRLKPRFNHDFRKDKKIKSKLKKNMSTLKEKYCVSDDDMNAIVKQYGTHTLSFGSMVATLKQCL